MGQSDSNETMASTPRFHMVGIMASDLKRSYDFYRRLGLALEDDGKHREAEVRKMTFFIDSDPHYWHPEYDRHAYPMLIEFYFDSLGELRLKLAEMKEAGYEVLEEPYLNAFGVWFAFIADPDGNTVLLSARQPPSEES